MQLACIVLQIKGRYFHSNILSEVRWAAETETNGSAYDEAAKQRSCYMFFFFSFKFCSLQRQMLACFFWRAYFPFKVKISPIIPVILLQFRARLTYFTLKWILHERFIVVIPTTRCQCTYFAAHHDGCEAAIIFLWALSWPRGIQCSSLLYQLTPTSSSKRLHHRAAFLTADNARRAEWTLHSRLHRAARGGPSPKLSFSCNQGNSAFQRMSAPAHHQSSMSL